MFIPLAANVVNNECGLTAWKAFERFANGVINVNLSKDRQIKDRCVSDKV